VITSETDRAFTLSRYLVFSGKVTLRLDGQTLNAYKSERAISYF
jgi:hypothetical protein